MALFHDSAIAGASGQAAGGAYKIERSLRFNSSDSAYLSRTPASAGNRKTWTWSGWLKRSTLGANTQRFFIGGVAGAGGGIQFESDTLIVFDFPGSLVWSVQTAAVFRDVSSWYHVVVAIDTTQVVNSNRVKLYVNGVQQTAVTATYPTLNYDGFVNSGSTLHTISSLAGSQDFFSGYLADIHFIDGQALDPTSFAETNITTGQWVPKAYTGTYGTNGFRLAFADNSNNTATTLGKDTSGNGNNWTPNNFSIGDTYKNAVVFDGSGDSFTAPSGASITGTGDFTIEMWLLPRSFGSGYQVIYANDTGGGVSIGINSSGTIFFGKSLQSVDGTTSSAVTFGAWNHIALTRTSGTFRIFINGTQGFSGTPSINYASGIVRVGADGGGSILFLNGLIASLRSIQGTSLYSTGFTPPVAPLSNVTGTTLLTCQSATLVDQSANNFTLTAFGDTHVVRSYVGAAVDGSDSTVDTPTSYGTDTGAGGEVRGNYCTLNPLGTAGATPTNGNLSVSSGSTVGNRISTFFLTSGKWYWEGSGNGYVGAIVGRAGEGFTGSISATGSKAIGWWEGGPVYWDGGDNGGGTTFTSTDVIGIALDMDAGNVKFYKNNSLIYTITFGSGTVPNLSSGVFPAYNIGLSPKSVDLNFGQRPFAYTAPSGFKALCDTNLPAPVVAKPNTVFDAVLYTANVSGGKTISMPGGFSPDLVWIKNRDNVEQHYLADTVRGDGSNKYLRSNSTNAEGGVIAGDCSITFGSSGFTLTDPDFTGGELYFQNRTYVSWNWDAGSSTVTNTQGSITSQVRANASAGFSIVTYSQGATNGTIGHGLGIAPAFIIVKSRTVSGTNWPCYHISLGKDLPLQLSTTSAQISASNYWGTTAPSATTFGVGTAGSQDNNNGDMVAYCFAPVAGYSSFGSYTGNGSADGPFVFCNFRPRWVLAKRTDSTGDWILTDSARNAFNVVNELLKPNLSDATETYSQVDFLSNGFKVRNTGTNMNASGGTYVYAAFAESPLQYARAR